MSGSSFMSLLKPWNICQDIVFPCGTSNHLMLNIILCVDYKLITLS